MYRFDTDFSLRTSSSQVHNYKNVKLEKFYNQKIIEIDRT